MADNVRVCLRFRPPNKIELKSKGHKIVAKVSSDNTQVTITGKKAKTFNFDYIFPVGSTQESVFENAGKLLVDQVLSGYNCTLFAYGQTGSGKTYSMEGVISENGDETHEGLIPRMVRNLFQRIMEDESSQFEYTLRVSFVEIYNEKLKDLLQPNGPPLKIREKTVGSSLGKGVYIENVHAPFVASPEEVFDHLTNGHINRTVAATRMNAHSSRGHAVFMLQLDARNTETGSSKASKLMLVDLAGSEKVRKTGASGQRLKEAQQINKSLMVLGLVINALVEGKKHVPYRDSKLTRLLSDALGGNSKTCLLIAASPSKYNRDETVGTLRFGARAKSIKNVAKVNQQLSVGEYKKLLEKGKKREEIYKEQIRSLQAQNAALIDECKKNNIDISKISSKQHTAAQNTTLMATMVPNTSKSGGVDSKEMEALQSKLDGINDEKNKFLEIINKKNEELQDANQELNECHTHIQEMQQGQMDLQQRYEELHAAKLHLDKLFQSLNSGSDANQNRFATEKLQWNEDKVQLLEEMHSKDRKIEELKLLKEENRVQMRELRAQLLTLQSASNHVIPQNGKGKNSKDIENVNVNVNGGLDEDNKAKMIALLDTARRYRSQNEKNSEEIKKLREKLKAYKRRDEVNKQLRENWNKQLNQMEQAVLLANEIYNRERTRHEAEMAEKDVEILKLRKFLLSFTNRHAKQSKSIASNGHSHSNGHSKRSLMPNSLHAPGTMNPNAPGARKSKIVKPKVIKAGGHAIKRRTFNNSIKRNSNRMRIERKSND